ncbi:hypothetical protein ACTFIT_008452 [Dictyostelium discoideum]
MENSEDISLNSSEKSIESSVVNLEDQQQSQQQTQQQTCQKTFVQEAPELTILIDKLIQLKHSNKDELISNTTRIIYIIDQYLEQPTLLDIHLNDIIQPLINFIKSNYINNSNNNNTTTTTTTIMTETEIVIKKLSIKNSFRIIYVLSKVRGFKTIVKLFQHEAIDLLPVLDQLEISYHQWVNINKQRDRLNEISVSYSSGINLKNYIKPEEESEQEVVDENNNNINNNHNIDDEYNENIISWEEVYVLALWVSLLVIIPFKFSSLDSASSGTASAAGDGGDGDGDGQLKSISSRILKLGKLALSDVSKIRDSFSELLSKLLNRPDMKFEQKQFIKWCTNSIQLISNNNNNNNQNNSSNNNILLIIGIYSTLATMFKKGNRLDFLPIDMNLYEKIMEANKYLSLSGSERITKKIFLKLLQRIAIIMLPPVSASWRYQKIIKPLLLKGELIKQINNNNNNNNNENNNEEGEEEEEEIPEEIDEILEEIMKSLKDKDTIIRWTSAKAIGRIVNLLPKDMGDQVIGLVIDQMFEKNEFIDADPSAWHGGCLALAELARRGLLLPERLDVVVPLVIRALFFDIIKGTYSIGSHVRDSACYLCWALARTYHNSILSPYLLPICRNLVVVSLYDREINCRKSASAAFQEMVGRHQGLVPNGIEIVTSADFFTVGNKNNSFTSLTTFIGKFQIDYYPIVIKHLATIKIYNWDLEIRQLASKSIHLLTNINPNDIVSNYLPLIIPNTQSDLVHVKHGASLAISEILISLFENNNINLLSDNLKMMILMTIKNTKNEKLFKGKGGVLIRIGMCKIIYSICLVEFSLDKNLSEIKKPTESTSTNGNEDRAAALKLKIAMLKAKTASQINKPIITPPSSKSTTNNNNNNNNNNLNDNEIAFNIILGYLNENLNHPNEEVQKEASKAFELLFSKYISSNEKISLLLELIDSHCKTLKFDINRSARRGSSLLLGSLPFNSANLSYDLLSKVVNELIISIFQDDPKFKDIETRVNSISSLYKIGIYILNLIFKNQENEQKEEEDFKKSKNYNLFIKIWNCLGLATNDYSIDKRGDIGSWVRELSCKVLFDFIKFIITNQNSSTTTTTASTTDLSIENLINEKMITEFICKLFQLSGEKLDKIRDVACKIIHELLWIENPSSINNIPHKEELKKIIVKDQDVHFNWFRTEESLPLICKVLKFNCYLYPLLFGLFSSLGGTSKYLINDSIQSIKQYFSSFDNDEKERFEKIISFSKAILEITNNTTQRMIQPTFRSIYNLLSTHIFDFLIINNLNEQSIFETILFNCYQIIESNQDDIYLLLNSIELFSYFFIQFENNNNEYIKDYSLKALLLLLSNLKYPKVRKLASDQLKKSTRLFINNNGDDETPSLIKSLIFNTKWDDSVDLIIEPLKSLLLLLNQKHLLELLSENPTKKPIPLAPPITSIEELKDKIQNPHKQSDDNNNNNNGELINNNTENNNNNNFDDNLPEDSQDLMEI